MCICTYIRGPPALSSAKPHTKHMHTQTQILFFQRLGSVFAFCVPFQYAYPQWAIQPSNIYTIQFLSSKSFVVQPLLPHIKCGHTTAGRASSAPLVSTRSGRCSTGHLHAFSLSHAHTENICPTKCQTSGFGSFSGVVAEHRAPAEHHCRRTPDLASAGDRGLVPMKNNGNYFLQFIQSQVLERVAFPLVQVLRVFPKSS